MRFTLIYLNNSDLRKAIEHFILEKVKEGFNFEATHVQHPQFQSKPGRLVFRDYAQLPLHFQAEEVIIENGALVSVLKLVIDAEMVVTPEAASVSQ